MVAHGGQNDGGWWVVGGGGSGSNFAAMVRGWRGGEGQGELQAKRIQKVAAAGQSDTALGIWGRERS